MYVYTMLYAVATLVQWVSVGMLASGATMFVVEGVRTSEVINVGVIVAVGAALAEVTAACLAMVMFAK